MYKRQAKGLPGAEGSLEAQPEKKSKLDIFNEALSEANNGPSIEAITEKKKAKEEAEAKAAAEKEAEEKSAAEAAAAEESADDSAEGEASEESSSDSE